MRGYQDAGRPLSSPSLAKIIVVRDVCLCIGMFEVNVRFCRCGGEPSAATEVLFGSGGIAVAFRQRAHQLALQP